MGAPVVPDVKTTSERDSADRPARRDVTASWACGSLDRRQLLPAGGPGRNRAAEDDHPGPLRWGHIASQPPHEVTAQEVRDRKHDLHPGGLDDVSCLGAAVSGVDRDEDSSSGVYGEGGDDPRGAVGGPDPDPVAGLDAGRNQSGRPIAGLRPELVEGKSGADRQPAPRYPGTTGRPRRGRRESWLPPSLGWRPPLGAMYSEPPPARVQGFAQPVLARPVSKQMSRKILAASTAAVKAEDLAPDTMRVGGVHHVQYAIGCLGSGDVRRLQFD